MTVLAMSAPAMASGGTTSGADLRLNGTLSTSQPAPGSTFTETYVVQNRGPDPAAAVQWTDLNDPRLPGLSVALNSVTVDGGPGDCSTTVDGNGNTAPFCLLGDLASGAQATVVVTRTAPTSATTYTFDGLVSSQTPDPQTGNNDFKLTIQVASGATATPPPGTNAPCATLTPSSSSQTQTGVLNKMSTKVSSCSTATMNDLVVVWDPGVAWESAFGCVAPQSAPNTTSPGLSFSLAPGATLQVNCQTSSLAGPGTFASGTGTVSVYADCKSLDKTDSTNLVLPDVSLSDPSLLCSQVASSLLGQQAFSWSIAIPSNQPPQGGNRGGG